jgi:plastocyanin
MRYFRVVAGLGVAALLAGLIGAERPSLAATVHTAPASQRSVAMTTPAPKTWQVIAGFTQVVPAGNGNTEAVNRFFPQVLTIHPGDKVTWTINSANEPHTITFGPDSLVRPLEEPQNQITPKMVNGKMQFVVNPKVFFPYPSHGPLVETDSGTDKTLLSCGAIGPKGAPGPQSCTITFPNVGSFDYDCLLHSYIPGSVDMDGTIKVVPYPKVVNNTWTVQAGSGNAIDANDGFVPDQLTIHAGDKVKWVSGGVLFHTVSFGIDPLKTPLFIPAGNGPQGPILAINPVIVTPVMPAGGIYNGGVANSGIALLQGNYLNMPGQKFVKAPFVLTFAKPGTYTYYCLIHPGMKGTITVLPTGQ